MSPKTVKKLHDKKHREDTGMFIVQGEKSVLELMTGPFAIEHIFATNEFILTHNPPHALTTKVSDAELRTMSTLESNTKALAIAKQTHALSIEDMIDSLSESPTILALDTIRDPGNLGTIIRTADWFGVTHILCSPTTVDFYNPKVISATMGSFCRVSVMYTELQSALRALKPHLTEIYGCVMDGEGTAQLSSSRTTKCIVMGSESHGITPEVDALVTKRITIPKIGGAESLNVGVAAGIVLHILT